MELNCENCIDHQKSIFSNLSTEEKKILQEKHQCRVFRKGEVIFQEGEEPVGLLSLANGLVKVFKAGVGGREQIVRMAKPVGFIGYRALFAEEKHTTTAVALEDSRVCLFHKDSLLKLMQQNFEVCFGIIKAFATELGFSINRTVTLTQKHIRGRLAESLIFLKDTYGYADDKQTINVYLSREDIANLSSMTTSNAIRTLSTFADEDIVELNGRRIKILDEEKLERISRLG